MTSDHTYQPLLDEAPEVDVDTVMKVLQSCGFSRRVSKNCCSGPGRSELQKVGQDKALNVLITVASISYTKDLAIVSDH